MVQPRPNATTVSSVLPVQRSPLIGRDNELALGISSLTSGHTRLLTLTGPGGVGKTSLAIEIANRLRNAFPDGVSFASLAAIADPGHVAAAVLHAVGLPDDDDIPVLDTLTAYLNPRTLLLVIDNFEQVSSARFLVTDLLDRCPDLRVLITSRTLLRLSGERRLPVQPLRFPNPANLPVVSDIAAFPAVRLFVERALDARDDFVLNEQNAATVSAVCARLDGLPLALELAAARLRHLPLAAIESRLAQRFALLTSGPHDHPSRLQSLQAAVGWSYDLLPPREQRLFQRLAVFHGGWTLDAAAAVIGFDGDSDSDAETLDALSTLIDQSLVQLAASETARPRYTMLETIREYARMQLAMGEEVTAIEARHTAYFVTLADRATRGLNGPNQVHWLELLETEWENTRAVLNRSITAGDSRVAIQMSTALWRFWARTGRLAEGRAWLERTLLTEGNDDPRERAHARQHLGYIALDLGDYELSRKQFEENHRFWLNNDDADGVSLALDGLGLIAFNTGEYSRARAAFEASFKIANETGLPRNIAFAHHNLGNVAIAEEQHDLALFHHGLSLAIRRDLGDESGAAYSLYFLGNVARNRGDLAAAKGHFAQSLAAFRTLGDRQGEAYALYGQARLALQAGDDPGAAALFQDVALPRRELGDHEGLIVCLLGLAGIVARRGQPEAAARVLGCAAATGLSVLYNAADRRDLENTRSVTRRALGDKAFEAAMLAGQEMRMEDALAEALALASGTGPAPSGRRPFDLSPRELEVLGLLGEHLTDREIADWLFLSPRTVERHVGSILVKLDVPNRRRAATIAVERRLV